MRIYGSYQHSSGRQGRNAPHGETESERREVTMSSYRLGATILFVGAVMLEAGAASAQRIAPAGVPLSFGRAAFPRPTGATAGRGVTRPSGAILGPGLTRT